MISAATIPSAPLRTLTDPSLPLEEFERLAAPLIHGSRPLLSWKALGTDLETFLGTEPPPPEWILTDLLRAGTVAGLVSTGGAGKSRLLIHLLLALATGTPFGPFRPAGPKRVLYLGGEDPGEILHERIYAIARGMGLAHDPGKAALIRQNFRAVALVGTDRVLIGRDTAGNPAKTPAYAWLSESLATMGRVDLLVLDPLSRFSSHEENDNNAATAFIACLESLAKRHGAAVLFSHHSSKAVVANGDARKDTGRGASALHDGARLMISMGSVEGAALGLDDPTGQGFIEVHQVKGNYSRLWGRPFYFAKGPGLTLTPVDPQEGIRGRQVSDLAEVLPAAGLSERAILKAKEGKPIRETLKEAFPKINLGKEIPLILTCGVENGLIERVEDPGLNPCGRPSFIFRPSRSSTETSEFRRKSSVSDVQGHFSESAMVADSHDGNDGKGSTMPSETSEARRKNSVSDEETAARANPHDGKPHVGKTSIPTGAFPTDGATLVADLGGKNHRRKNVTPKGEG